MQSTRYFFLILIKLVFSRQILEKCSNITLHENSSNGSRVVSCGRTYGRTDGQTDRHDEANSRFSQLRETGLKNV